MNSQKLLKFKEKLEEIATYNNKTVTPEEFSEFFRDLKQSTLKNGISMPEIFKYSGNQLDFRRRMQEYDNYADRRRVLDDAIYSLCDSFDKLEFMQTNNRQIPDRKNLIKNLKERREIVTKYGSILYYAH